MSLIELQRFVRHPVRMFFTARLGVSFDAEDSRSEDHEPYEMDALQVWGLRDELIRALVRAEAEGGMGGEAIRATVSRMQDRGDLVAGNLGVLAGQSLCDGMDELLLHYREACRRWPEREEIGTSVFERISRADGSQLELVDQVSDIRRNHLGERVRVVMQAGHLVKNRTYRAHALIGPWLAHLAGNLDAGDLMTLVLSPQGEVLFKPVDAAWARERLMDGLHAWDLGMRQPLPIACRTALAWLRSLGPSVDGEDIAPDHPAWAKARETYENEVAWCPYLSRSYADFDALSATGMFAHWAVCLYRGLANAIQAADGFLAPPREGGGE